MAEFDSNAFSAVNSFFGVEKEDPGKAQARTVQNSSKTKRLGVGAAVIPKTPTIDTTSRLLHVGKKKRKAYCDNDDDEEDVVLEDDEEEELGRTGIATETEPHKEEKNIDPLQSTSKKKKKKKSGKKERQQLKKEQSEAAAAEAVDAQAGNENEDETKEATQETPQNEEDEKPIRKQKRKRRKVRSRQKNIYKDNRTAEEKPDHLVPGGYEYKGRPMTTATRSKLEGKQLIPANPDAFKANWDTTDQEMEDNGVPVLGSAGVVVERKGIEISSNKRKDKTKKKKSKYKNIQ